MKKEQKIIELRTAAKLRISELRTKIAFAHSEAAAQRARIMSERAAELNGLEAGSTERYDVLAKYRAKLARLQEKHSATIADFKCEIQKTKSGCEQLCAAAKDDPEPTKEPQQETVYCDGSEHTARIVARRLINKMPRIPVGGCLFVHVLKDGEGACFVSVSESDDTGDKYVLESLSRGFHNEEQERAFVDRARDIFKCKECGAKTSEPMARELDAIFSGNPVEHLDNIISETVKDRKEGGDE